MTRSRAEPLLPVLGGVLMGAAHLDPRLGSLVWVGLALFAYGLRQPSGPRAQLLGIFGATWASLFLSQIWLCRSIGLYMGPAVNLTEVPLWMSSLAWVGIACIPAAHASVPVALGALLLRRLPLSLWLPVALLLGEALRGALGFTMGDLMHAQWGSAGMLRSVALIGLPATQLLASLAAVALADATADRRPRWLLLAMPVALWFVALPPTPANDEALRGVTAIHLANFEHRPQPQELSPEVELVVWPEATIRGAFATWEGLQSPPVQIDELAGWEGRQHVVNLRIKRNGQTMNAIGLTDAEGQVRVLRGKSSLVPWGERPYAGMDFLRSTDVVGDVPPLFEANGLSIVPTICYEVYARSLFVQGAQLGGDLLLNVANDRAYGPTELGIRQAIGVLALRAAETGLPAVRASISGRAALISSTGALLALSEPGTSGALRSGEAQRPEVPMAILSDGGLPDPFPCEGPTCLRLRPDEPACSDASPRVGAVVVSGHSLPPRYLGLSADELAQRIACLEPDLIVLDTCYGFSSPLLQALAARGVRAQIVGAHRQVAKTGLRYGPDFFEASDPEVRSAAVGAGDDAVERWRADPDQLAAALLVAESWSPDELKAHIQRVHPNLVRVPLADSGAVALVLVPPERFQYAPPRRQLRAISELKRSR